MDPPGQMADGASSVGPSEQWNEASNGGFVFLGGSCTVSLRITALELRVVHSVSCSIYSAHRTRGYDARPLILVKSFRFYINISGSKAQVERLNLGYWRV